MRIDTAVLSHCVSIHLPLLEHAECQGEDAIASRIVQRYRATSTSPPPSQLINRITKSDHSVDCAF